MAAFLLLFQCFDNQYFNGCKNFGLPCHKEMVAESFQRQFVSPVAYPSKFAQFGKFSGIAAGSAGTILILATLQLWHPGKVKTARPATISKNNIMLNEYIPQNKKSEDMKKFQTLGAAILVTASTLTMPVKAQPVTRVSGNVTSRVSAQPAVSVNVAVAATATVSTNIKTTTAVVVDLSGTFYGEKLRWSAENYELYFDGKSVIAFGTNNFVSNGTTSFLGKVYYLVIDGRPVNLEGKVNKLIRLSEKKYNLIQVSPEHAIIKYGEEGKNGAIEISLAE